MEIFAGLSVGCLILVALVVAIKTFALWLRSRALPEFLLSAYLLCATVLGYPLMIASSRVSPNEMWALHVGGHVIMTVGFTCLLLFTLNVFRPDAVWARGIVGASVLLFAVGVVIYFNEMTGENPRAAADLLGINLLTTTPIAIAYFWTTVESLSYHRRLKSRLRLGLAEATVVNRVLLWGLMTLAAGTAVVIALVGMVAGVFMTTSLVVVLSCLGTAHASCLFFAFHPPAWYRAWLERGAPAAAS